MAKGPTKQHYVPRCYLAEWIDPNTPAKHEPYVWVFNKGERKGRKKAPANLFTETDLYTLKLDTGEKNYSIEETLSGLESRYAAIFQNKIKNHLPLNDEEHFYLCAFVGTMLQRTLRQKENIENSIDQLIERTEELERAHGIPPKESEGLKRYKKDAHKKSMMQGLQEITELLARMSLAFLCAEGGSKFVTSDNPCNLFNPELQWQQIYGPGLTQKHVEVTLPLSPNIMLHMSWQQMRGYARYAKEHVEEANRMKIGHCHQYFVSCSPKTRRHWYRRYPLDFFFILKILKHKIVTIWKRFKTGRQLRVKKK